MDFNVGNRFIIEPSGTSLTSEEHDLFAQLSPAGIMLRKRNFLQNVPYDVWTNAVQLLIAEVRKTVPNQNCIISIDHEGGRVVRAPPPITRFPYPARWGDRWEEVAAALATEVRSLGVNMLFGPVADVHSNPLNPVINERAFGQTAEEVVSRVVKVADIFRRHGLVPCAKHFPGHGDTASDSHYQLPVVQKTKEQLLKLELVPFQALIDDGIEMIMTAHILFPHLDPHFQATLSPIIMNQLLRDEMEFSGVTVSDAMGMSAIADSATDMKNIQSLLRAELDLILMVGDTVTVRDALRFKEEVVRCFENDPTLEVFCQRSSRRIMALLNGLPQHEVTTLDAAQRGDHQALAQACEKTAPWSGFNLQLPGFE